MSELNKKKSSFKFIIIYAILAIAITGILIFLNIKYDFDIKKEVISLLGKEEVIAQNEIQKNNVILNNEVTTDKTKKEIEKLKPLDKYYTNNIKFIKKKINKGDFLFTIEYGNGNEEKFFFDAEYIEIDGLKDKEVQEKINKDIKDNVIKIYNQNKDNPNVKKIEVYMDSYTEGNFSDVLSIGMRTTVLMMNPDSDNKISEYYSQIQYNEEDYKITGLNYKLESGEKIKFDELFTEDTDIKSILTKAVYEYLSFEYIYNNRQNGDGYFDGDMDTIEYPEIEDNLIKIMSAYKQNKDINYYFTSTYITTIINGNIINIKMIDNLESLAIFTKFLSKDSLYEEENLPKVNYVCKMSISDKAYMYEDISDNIFVEIMLYFKEDDENDINKKEVYQDFVNKMIKKIKNNSEKDKGYIYNIYLDEYEGKISGEAKVFETDKKYYKEKKEELKYTFTAALIDYEEKIKKVIDEEKVETVHIGIFSDENNNIVFNSSKNEPQEITVENDNYNENVNEYNENFDDEKYVNNNEVGFEVNNVAAYEIVLNTIAQENTNEI